MKIKGNAASVEFRDISKLFGAVTAVDGISLIVAAGQLVTLLGPSGCGKTTTLRMIAGLEMASSGAILIGGKDVTRLPATDRDVSMVFQSYALFPHMTVEENVSYGLKLSGFDAAGVRERTEAGLALVGLKGFGARLPSELSGGQQQRVAVARALVLEPQVLLFDEPLSNLDAKLRRQVREEIREIQTNLGLTVVYVTHDQEEALAVSDRIVVMNNGRIAQEGTPRELYEQPLSVFVADFIGEANILPCRIEVVKGGTAEVDVDGMIIRLASRGLAKGEARLAVRPNRIVLSPGRMKAAIAGTLRKATYVGSHWEYRAATKVGDIFVTALDGDERLAIGSPVSLTFAKRGPVLLLA
jgi:iron(III) transport system ATP-binding protein